MDQFAWTKSEALYYMGVLMSVGAVIACITFLAINPICKLFAERKVMLWGGFFTMVIGRALYIPWGDEPPLIYDDSLKNNATYLSFLNGNYCDKNALNLTVIANETSGCVKNITELVGCPSSQRWCSYTPAMTITQFILGYAMTVVGYPIGVTLIQTIFSKILGPRPQGIWMGLITGSGCLSRVMGPVFVSYIYTELGTTWTFGMTTVMMALSMIWLYIFLDRLIPQEEKHEIAENGTELHEINIKENDPNAIEIT